MQQKQSYYSGFLPYGMAAFLIGITGGFSTVLGPAFVAELGIADQNTTWTALAQAVSTAACAPILGRLGDVLGRQLTLLLGIAVFTLGNLLSALADSLGFMLVARFFVGVGTAAMTPVILAYIVNCFPKDKMAGGFSLYMLISSASVIFGPSVGSWLLAGWGWRAMVWVCVCICTAVFAICALTIRKEPAAPRKCKTFDPIGAGMVFLFFSLLLCMPAVGQSFGWRSGVFAAVAVAGMASLVGLVYTQKRAAVPILPGSLLKRRAFLGSILALFLTQGIMQADMTNLIVFVRYTRPENAMLSGYVLSVMYLGMSLGAVLLGPLADKTEAKQVLLASVLVTAVGCGSFVLFTAATPGWLLMTALGLLGFGLGGNGTIFMKIALSGLPAPDAATGTGVYGLFRDLAAPFGVAVLVPLFTNQITTHMQLGTTTAAVRAMHILGWTELACVLAAVAVVICLPSVGGKEQGV